MLSTDKAQGTQDQDKQQFCNSDGALHIKDEVDMDEFSQLLSKVSTEALWKILMTQQQRTLATALWEACNYGGKPKPENLNHMEKKRLYAEWVLRISHRDQWNKAKNPLNCVKDKKA